MRVLVACEHSGVVRDAFRAQGHEAWSCDLLCGDRDSEYHMQGDALTMGGEQSNPNLIQLIKVLI